MNTHNAHEHSDDAASSTQQGVLPQQEEHPLRDAQHTVTDQREAQTISAGWKYDIVKADLDTPAIFSVKLLEGKNTIRININHPAYAYLVDMLECDEAETADVTGLQERLNRAYDALKLLLTAWALYEDYQVGKPQKLAQEVRVGWGIFARELLKREE